MMNWLRTFKGFILTSALCVCAGAGHASSLPPINLDAYTKSYIAPMSANDEHVVISGKSFDLVTYQPLSSKESDALKAFCSDVFSRDLDYAQASRIVPVIRDALGALGYSKAQVRLEAPSAGHPRIAARLAEGWNKPKSVNLSVFRPALEMAARTYYTTAAGAAMRNLNDSSAKDPIQPKVAPKDYSGVRPSVLIANSHPLAFPVPAKTDKIATLAKDNGKITKDEPKSPEKRAEAMLQAAAKKADEQKTAGMIAKAQSAASFAKSYADAADKKVFLKAAASGWASAQANDWIASLLEGYKGVNAQIDFGISQLETVTPSGKILVPFVNKPKYVVFAQGGALQSSGDRTIVHGGLGARFYPEAKSKSDSGRYMFGFNNVYDFDVSRGHKRMSVGAEFMTNAVFLAANWYQRLSGWKSSRDFENGMIEERPANGFDLNAKYFVPRHKGLGRLALTGSVTHWIGRDISPFGNTEHLENSPWVYSGGLEWQPVPAITASLKHAVSDGGHSNTSVNVSFNVPLGAVELPRAFDPDADNLASGMNVNESRSMFITRDYQMPLQYRSQPGKFTIRYCGLTGDDTHCFEVLDGFGRPAAGAVVRVTASDPCVKFNNNGVYTVDPSGHFYVKVLTSCTPKTSITIHAGDTSITIDIEVRKLDLTIQAVPSTIARYKHSIVTLKGLPDSAGVPVTWSLSGAGSLNNGSKNIGITGFATVEFVPDSSAGADYQAVVTATVNGSKFSAPILVKFYGSGSGDGDSPLKFDLKGRDYIEGNEILTISYPGLEPGATIEWSSSGDGTLCLGADGSDQGQNFTSEVNENGTAVMYIKAADVDQGAITITAKTPDGNLASAHVSVNVKSFIATATGPSVTAAGDPFTLKLAALKPGTEVTWPQALMANPQASSSVVADDGTASMTYTTLSDAYSGKITGLKAKYYRNVGASAQADFPEITLTEYTPVISSFPEYFSGNDSFILTLTGVKPGYPVIWSVKSGSATLTDAQNVADSSGVATVKVTGVDPYTGTVEISATAMGQEVVSKGTYHTWGAVFNLPTFTSIYGKTTNLDYNGGVWSFSVSGMLPGSEVSLTGVDVKTVKADSTGTATFDNLPQRQSDGEIKLTYIEKGSETTTVTQSVTVASYPLTLSAGKTTLNAYADDAQTLDSTTVTLSGCKPGANVTWKITGDGSLSSVVTVADSQGNATAVVNSRSPFTTPPEVSASSLGGTAQINFTFSVTTYAPNVVMPSFTSIYGKTTSLDYAETWTMKVANVLPKSKVTVSSAALGTKSVKADSTGTATFSNLSAQTAGGSVNVNYLSSGITYADTSASYSVADYPVTLKVNKTALNAYGANAQTMDSAVATVSGCKPGASVTWSVSGNGTLSNIVTTADSSGNATAVVNSAAPFTNAPVVTASSLNHSAQVRFSYSLTTYTPAFALPTFKSIYNKTTNLDYDGGAWSFAVTGLLPGSRASITGVASQTVTVDNSGKATFSNIPQRESAGTISLTYLSKGTTNGTSSASVSVADYPLTASADKTEIFADDTSTVTISGGKPGAAVTFSSTGDGTVISKSSNFDNSGNAYLKVQGRSPYSTSITVTATSI